MNEPTIWTIGHSTHPIEHFLRMLESATVEALADVRRFPGSRRQPQFGQEPFQTALAEAGIAYRHFPALGGRRHQRLPESPNTAWRVEAFNAYADHMQSAEFRTALGELEALARSRHVAMMCSEAVSWRCHRRLIADALVARGWRVLDIYAPSRTKEHKLTDFAQVRGDEVIYPGLFE